MARIVLLDKDNIVINWVNGNLADVKLKWPNCMASDTAKISQKWDGSKFVDVPFVAPQWALDSQVVANYPKLKALVNMTPAQIQTWVDNNVNTLADAKDAIKTLAVAVGILARNL